ncbi:glycosyltransferase family 4 protein [Piscinibacter sakaiensis]|uniref:Glycosyltransferase n=1 Tax=Piscinibacter sakaiensis TaxID=1547922 RepID=A0A0K8P192_PISS1|nr:glycosyltransferase family 1 protein [Piscinibacter sakaiensis]GAP36401.1 glycosyltransferase [Piscinibacter sakaiensis]
MPPLSIACVTETYPPEVNGVALTVAQVVEGLRAQGHRVDLVRPWQPADADRPVAADECLRPGWPIPRYAELRMGSPNPLPLLARWRARRPDVVHIATEGPLGWAALQAARRLGLPVCSDFRTNFHQYGAHYGLGWLAGPIEAYLRRFHNRCGRTLVPTEAMRQTLAARGFQRVEVVGRGIDTQRFAPGHRSEALRAAWGVAPHERVMACVGRLAPEKNLDTVLRAYEAARRAQPGLRLLLVGDGPLRPALRARCPDALFAGTQHGEALAAHYASADLFVFASLTETYGNVVPEALASGLPVVAYGQAAAAELVVSGRNGRLAAPGDATAFIDAVIQVLGDEAGRQAMADAARRSVEARGWGTVVARIARLLAEEAGPAVGPRRPAGSLGATLPG